MYHLLVRQAAIGLKHHLLVRQAAVGLKHHLLVHQADVGIKHHSLARQAVVGLMHHLVNIITTRDLGTRVDRRWCMFAIHKKKGNSAFAKRSEVFYLKHIYVIIKL